MKKNLSMITMQQTMKMKTCSMLVLSAV